MKLCSKMIYWNALNRLNMWVDVCLSQSTYSAYCKVRYSIRQSWSSCFSINKHKFYCKRLNWLWFTFIWRTNSLRSLAFAQLYARQLCVFDGFNICNKSRCEGWQYPTFYNKSKCDGVIVVGKDVVSFFFHHHHNSWNIVRL